MLVLSPAVRAAEVSSEPGKAGERFGAAVVRWFSEQPLRFGTFFLPALVVALAVFSRSPLSNYIFDEQEALLANPYVNGEVPWLDVVRRDFWGLPSTRSIGSYRPLPNLIWRCLWWAGKSPWVLHLANLTLHAAVAALLARFVALATHSRPAAWFSGAYFLCCGLLTEAVTGVVGLADVLSGLGIALSLMALRMAAPWMGLAVWGSLSLGFLAKESTLAVLPALVWAGFVTAPLLHPDRPRAGLRGAIVLVAAAAALVSYTYFRREFFKVELPPSLSAPAPEAASWVERGMHEFLRWFRQPRLPHDPVNNPLVEATPTLRVAGALRVYLRGLVQVFVPWQPSGDYSYSQEPIPDASVSVESILGATFLVLPVLLGLLLGALAWKRNRRPPRHPLLALLALALVWVPVVYFPHSNIATLLPTVRADRFWYLPVIGVALASGPALAAACARFGRAAFVLSFVLLGFHALQARAHALHYTDDLVFWRATRVSSPRSAKAHLNYGVMLGARRKREARLEATANAVRLAPAWPMGQVYYGDALCRMGRADEAWPYYERGFILNPNGKSLIALGLQCLWDEGALKQHRARLEELALDHPGSWLAYLATEIFVSGEQYGGVEPKHRPRAYDQGPKQ